MPVAITVNRLLSHGHSYCSVDVGTWRDGDVGGPGGHLHPADKAVTQAAGVAPLHHVTAAAVGSTGPGQRKASARRAHHPGHSGELHI